VGPRPVRLEGGLPSRDWGERDLTTTPWADGERLIGCEEKGEEEGEPLWALAERDESDQASAVF